MNYWNAEKKSFDKSLKEWIVNGHKEGTVIGHYMGTSPKKYLVSKGNEDRTQAHHAKVPILPRLLDLGGAASYLGVSHWTIRDLEAGGILPRVRVPLPNHGELRKLLFDREDLDRLIDGWKER